MAYHSAETFSAGREPVRPRTARNPRTPVDPAQVVEAAWQTTGLTKMCAPGG